MVRFEIGLYLVGKIYQLSVLELESGLYEGAYGSPVHLLLDHFDLFDGFIELKLNKHGSHGGWKRSELV